MSFICLCFDVVSFLRMTARQCFGVYNLLGMPPSKKHEIRACPKSPENPNGSEKKHEWFAEKTIVSYRIRLFSYRSSPTLVSVPSSPSLFFLSATQDGEVLSMFGTQGEKCITSFISQQNLVVNEIAVLYITAPTLHLMLAIK